MTTELHLKNLGKTFDHNTWLFRNLQLSAKTGDVIHVRGKNGSGKSTLLKILSSRILPSQGNSYIGELDIAAGSSDVKAAIALSDTQSHFFPKLTGAENLQVFSHFREIPKDVFQETLQAWKNNPAFAQSLSTPYAICSSGMRQALRNFLAFCQKPRLLLLDEAGTSLDHEAKSFLLEKIESSRKQSVCIIVSHSPWVESLQNIQRLDL